MTARDKLTPISEAPVGYNYRERFTPPAVATINEQQRIFITEYLLDYNPFHAAVRAGYHGAYGAQLMKHPGIARMIELAIAERHARVGISIQKQEDVMGAIVNGDPRDLFRDDGTMKLPAEMTKDAANLIGGWKTRRYIELDEDGKKRPVEVQEIKLVDRNKTIDMVNRRLGAYKDTLTIDVTVADGLRKAMKRIGKGADSVVDAIEAEFEEITEPSLAEMLS